MSLKNVMVAQSGGPTVAINASLAGVIRGVMASDQYETVYKWNPWHLKQSFIKSDRNYE